MDLTRVTAPEARELLEKKGYVLLDVRSTPEFVAEHAAGAYNVPFLHKQPHGMVSNPDFARVVEAAFPDRATKLITTCAMGGRSSRAAQALLGLGYTQVIDLRGGFEGERDDRGVVVAPGWKSSGLPTETGETKGRSYLELYAKLTARPSAPPPPAGAGAAGAGAAGGHSHSHGDHGHSHGDHGHSHGDHGHSHDDHGHSHGGHSHGGHSHGGHSHGGHSHGGHSHGGHSHGHGGHSHGAPAPAAAAAPATPALNRFADPNRLVDCAKLGRRLPGLKRRPLGGALGDRVFATISAEAWALWAEHSKLLINEYRLNPADAPAQEMLIKQCETFLFGGEGAEADKPKEFRPQ